MNDRRRGLGRGLGALIPTVPVRAEEGRQVPGEGGSSPVDVLIPERGSEQPDTGATAGAYFAEIPVADIRPNARQPRHVFDEDALDELVASIREVGLLQPVVVRNAEDGRFELVMGERRWRAAQLAGLSAVPAIVRSTGDEDMLRDALLENLHRSELNPLEEAAAYDQLLQDFGCSHDELASRIGRSRPQITNTLRLLRLPAGVQRRVAAGVLSAGHAMALLAFPSSETQEDVARRIVAEGLSVRAVEELASLGDVPATGSHKPVRANRPVAPRLDDIAARLSDRLETRVRVELGRRKGKVVVEFATVDDLERIVSILNVPVDSSRPSDGHAPLAEVPVLTADHEGSQDPAAWSSATAHVTDENSVDDAASGYGGESPLEPRESSPLEPREPDFPATTPQWARYA